MQILKDRDELVSSIHWPVQNNHAFFYFFGNLFVFDIIYFVCIIITKTTKRFSGSHTSLKEPKAGGQGFDPCLQQIAFCQLFSGNQVCVQAGGSPYSLTNQQARWPDLVAKPWGHTMDSVNDHALDHKKLVGPASIGPINCFQHLPKSGPISLSLIFCSFNLIILFCFN